MNLSSMKYKIITTFKGTPTQKLLYGYMLDLDMEEVTLSFNKISRDLKLSRRAVIDNINKLCKLGIIRKIPRTGEDGGSLANKYKLM
ncbi:MAG: hypothetical protein GX800_08760 [Clostridiaceae bacterium]|nr:hypothetical protein [Clostridiaceae bacterium]